MNLKESSFVELEHLFLALGDKTRLKILALLADGELPVGFLADRLDESQPKVSRHLAYLRNTGVVNTRRDGKWIYYEISEPEDAVVRRILNTVVQSLAVMRVDGDYVYFTETVHFTDEILNPSSHTYAEADMTDEYQTDRGRDDEQELDIFLL